MRQHHIHLTSHTSHPHTSHPHTPCLLGGGSGYQTNLYVALLNKEKGGEGRGRRGEGEGRGGEGRGGEGRGRGGEGRRGGEGGRGGEEGRGKLKVHFLS